MREYVTEYVIANTIRMTRTQHTGSFLIVEGDTDARLYKRFVDGDRCRTIVAHNKDNAIGALSILEKDGFLGVLAIVDADFMVLEQTPLGSQNLLLTDTHDLETMIIKSPALDKVLSEFASEAKFATFVKKSGKDIRITLIECGMPVGYLRWVSLREGLSLTFEDLDFDKFVDKETLTVEVSRLIKTVKDKSQKHTIAESNIQNSMRQLKNDSHNHWHICCGHDLVCILSIGLRKAIGTNDAKDVEPKGIERSLRLAFERSHFSKTQLYSSIQGWEKTNEPFVVLNIES